MSTELPTCPLREPTESDGIYFCGHPRMHAAQGLVSSEICRLCSVRTVSVDTPRTRADLQTVLQPVRPARNLQSRPFRPPSLLQRGWNLAQSLAAFTADGLKTVTKEQYQHRLSICDTCDRRDGTRCLQCGCGLALKAKGRAFRCPLGKW